MASCNCDFCTLNAKARQFFKPDSPFSKQIKNVNQASEIITADLSMLFYNTAHENYGVISNESLAVIKELLDSTISNTIFMLNADITICSVHQSVIYTEYILALKCMSTDAVAIIDEALEISHIPQRYKFLCSNKDFDTTKYFRECINCINAEMNKLASSQLG